MSASLAAASAGFWSRSRWRSGALTWPCRRAGASPGALRGAAVGGFTGFSSGMAKVVNWAGRHDARKLFDLVEEAKSIIRERVERHQIDCDRAWGYVHGANKPRQLDGLRRNQDLWARDFAYDDTRMAETQEKAVQYVNSPSYIGGLYEVGAGHLHPLNYCLGLARAAKVAGVRIFEGSLVQRIESGARAAVSVRLLLAVRALGLGHLFAGDPAVAVEVEAQETTRALGLELLQRDCAVAVPVEAIEVPGAGGARLHLGDRAVLVRIQPIEEIAVAWLLGRVGGTGERQPKGRRAGQEESGFAHVCFP